MRNKNNPGLYEQDDLSPQDLLNIQHPMLTTPDGRKVVACTECHKRPLAKARLCDQCFAERMEKADWESKMSIVRRSRGTPRVKCPWCGKTTNTTGAYIETCCGEMEAAWHMLNRQQLDYEKNRPQLPGEL